MSETLPGMCPWCGQALGACRCRFALASARPGIAQAEYGEGEVVSPPPAAEGEAVVDRLMSLVANYGVECHRTSDLAPTRELVDAMKAVRTALAAAQAEAERWRKLREVGVVTRDEDGGLVFVAPLPEPKERPLGIAVSDPDGVEDEINRAFGLPRALRALPATPSPGPSAEDVFGDVRAERAKQDAQWGGPAHDDQHSDWDWLRFIQRHARLAAATPLNEQARYQWVRVAALAVAAIESHDRKVAALTRTLARIGLELGCPGGQS